MTAVKNKAVKIDMTDNADQADSILEEVAPDYWGQACKELMKQDRILKKLIPKYGSGFWLRAAIRLIPWQELLLGNRFQWLQRNQFGIGYLLRARKR